MKIIDGKRVQKYRMVVGQLSSLLSIAAANDFCYICCTHARTHARTHILTRWKDKWDCAQCLQFTNFGLDDEVLEAWSYVKWPGPGEKALAAKLNGQISWMLTPR